MIKKTFCTSYRRKLFLIMNIYLNYVNIWVLISKSFTSILIIMINYNYRCGFLRTMKLGKNILDFIQFAVFYILAKVEVSNWNLMPRILSRNGLFLPRCGLKGVSMFVKVQRNQLLLKSTFSWMWICLCTCTKTKLSRFEYWL